MKPSGCPRRPPGPAGGFLLALAMLALVPVRPAGAQERFRRTPPLPDALPLELKLPEVVTVLLPNGLTVATAPQPGAPLVTLQLIIRAGEADSPPDRPGVAAMTARMIGKGTKLLSADYLENVIESIGAEFSVTVLMDYTALTMHVLEEHLDRAIYAMRLIALEAVFTERDLGAVRRTAFGELFERQKNPEALGWRQLLRVLFENHPYQTATYAEDVIKFITVKDVAAFYDRFYRPGNASVLASGRIDGDAVTKKIRDNFGAWSGPPVERAAAPKPPPNDRERICFIEAPDQPDATIFAGNIIMDSSDPDFFPFLVLKQVLGGTTRSRLFMNLRESKGYAYYAFSETEFFRSCGVYWARARVRPESIGPAVREIVREIGALAAEPAVPAEIEEAKSYLIGNLPLRFESPEGFADWMARYVALGLDRGHWDRGPEQFKLVNVDRVQEAARKYLAGKPLVVIVGRPEWLGPTLDEFDPIEVYDTSGKLTRILRKGDGP
jgi:predicted Zn-dependent peptidase